MKRTGAGKRALLGHAAQPREHGGAVSAYVRVSTRGQDYDYQRHAIERAAAARGEQIDRWYADVASGASMERPELRRLLEHVRAGELRRLWVWRLDRLTRSGIVDTLSAIELLQEHGCECTSVADGFALDGPAAPVVLAVLAWAAERERERIHEAQQAARERMEAQGRTWGRPRKVSAETIAAAVRLRGSSFTQREIAKHLELSRSHVGAILRAFDRKAAAENTPLQNGDPVR